MLPRSPAFIAAAALVAAGCGDGGPGGPNSPPYDPEIPAEFTVQVTNQYFPLVPGTRYEFEGQTDEGPETTVVEVLEQTRVVNGVEAVVVRDRVYLDGELIEDTHDWYAQDGDGNVWYLGEDSKEIEGGVVVGSAGSWEWGVDGALPGVIMWADPLAHLDQDYRQEYYEGVAEDWARVLGTDRDVEVPFGSFSGCLETEDWNGLEPGSEERKFYC
ncbi:MAG: hypothetical protein L0214_15590, partial [candidate division NC10 bacterium]|nr:hypothetical protein [candidate division NC10 bacterium]